MNPGKALASIAASRGGVPDRVPGWPTVVRIPVVTKAAIKPLRLSTATVGQSRSESGSPLSAAHVGFPSIVSVHVPPLFQSFCRRAQRTRERALKVVLALVGLLFLAALYPLPMPHEPALQMMLGVYVTLGLFRLLAVRNPPASRSLIALYGVVEPGARGDHGGATVTSHDPTGRDVRRDPPGDREDSTDRARARQDERRGNLITGQALNVSPYS